MNTRTTLLAVLTAALALPALADTTAPVTREQVKAEYIRALKAGELDFAREFVTPVSRPSSLATANKVEELAPTAAGQQATVKATKTAH
ncbi:MAG: DUF4148 domain-containing protein [Aquabacterium sp.]|uniref:DUF4148 domain-containing protein n=1 Tax=Aquabacterium sp. TaxID=1872578 RepID=UPI002724BFD4|nr:DUF4148 domain-containing protein [Aquabacterium sp.]MDO9003155.1 DUF4148 domain-containing protein [Aquabacterium sp.]